MEVKVQKSCGRCGRKTEMTVTLETASAMAVQEKEAQDKWDRLSAVLAKSVGEIFPNGGPELIVLNKSQDGYGVGKLENLCSLPGAERNRGCQARVNALLKEIFMENKKARKPRSKKEKAPEASNGAPKAKK